MGLRILVVDDDPVIRRLAVRALTSHSDNIVRCASAADEAMRQVKRFRPELILLDLLMPEGDGYELLDMLSRDPGARAIPVIFVTGASSRLGPAAQDSVIGVLSKPFSVATFAKTVEDIYASSYMNLKVAPTAGHDA